MMVIGFLSAVIFIILLSKFLTRRGKNRKIDVAMLKIHKVLGCILLFLAIIHNAGVWNLYRQRLLSMIILGYMMLFLIVAGVASYFLRFKIGRMWIKIHRITAVLLSIVLIAHIGIGFWGLSSYKQKISQIEIEQIDLNKISDGEYEGSYDVGFIYAKVKVTIEEHKIIAINILEHRTERGKKAESIVDFMIEQQALDVDAISGATNSSKVIMKAVQNALTSN